MLVASYKTVSDIEILWVLIASIGMVFAFLNFLDARKDKIALDLAGVVNGRRLIAWGAQYQDAARAVVHTIFVIIGVCAFFVPNTTSPGAPLSYQIVGIAIRWGLVIASIALVSQSIVSRYSRKKLLEHALEHKL